MSKPLPNALTVEKSFTIEYLDRSFLVALNSIGQHEFSGKLAYALYRNSKTVDVVIRGFQKQMDSFLRLHAESDGKGNIATQADATGNQGPKFRSDEDRKRYLELFNIHYRQTPITLRLQVVDETELEEAILKLAGGVSSNVLSTLRPMIDDREDGQDTTSTPMSVVRQENVPSGPEVINTAAPDADSVNSPNDQPNDLSESEKESSASPVLE